MNGCTDRAETEKALDEAVTTALMRAFITRRTYVVTRLWMRDVDAKMQFMYVAIPKDDLLTPRSDGVLGHVISVALPDAADAWFKKRWKKEKEKKKEMKEQTR